MKFSDLMHETYASIFSNKVRSGLTMLGIVIGISSVIVMVAIGQGAQGSIQSNIQSLGSNLIMVQPGMQRGVGMQVSSGRGSAKSLTIEDAEAILTDTGLAKDITYEVSGRYQVIAKGTNTNTSIVGTTPNYLNVRNIEIEEGNFINQQNVSSLSKVAVIGPTARDDLFGEDAQDVVGQVIKIKGMNFKIIGITKAKGGTGFGSQDDMIFVPVSTAQKFLSGNKYLSGISVQAIDTESMDALQEEITNLLLSRHNIKDAELADFSTLNQEDIVASASSITGTLTMLLASIAGISLIVGGIGIMNMMLTNVTERTKEIGLRKAVGAKNKDISTQFLAEAIFLTFTSGGIGIILGWIISYAFNYFGIVQTNISLLSILLAFGVSTGIGILFGYYPAKKASLLNPIEALRYE